MDAGRRDAAAPIDVAQADALPRDADPTPVVQGDAAPDTTASPMDATPARDVAPGPTTPISQPGSGAALADVCGGALAVTEVALYQAVKIPLAKDGGEISPRATRIVEKRASLLRVFVAPRTSAGRGDASVRLTVRGAGTTKTYEQTKVVTAASTDDALASTFNFEVPGTELPADAAYAVEIIRAACGEPTAASRYPQAGEAPLGSVATGVLKIRLVPVRYDTDGSSRLPDTSPAQLAAFRALLLAVFPVRDVELTTRAPVGTQLVVTATSGWTDLLEAVRVLRRNDAPADDVYYYGLVNPSDTGAIYCGTSCIAGIAYQNSASDPSTRVGLGIGFLSSRTAEAMAHEIGHGHGRLHSPCGGVKDPEPSYPYAGGATGAWGYDPRTKVLIDPAKAKDMMGYCDPRWVSDFTYRAFLERSLAVNADVGRILPLRIGVATRFRTLLVDDGVGRWGLGAEGEPFGERRKATILDAAGAPITTVDAYRTAVGDTNAATWLLPEPRPGWHAVLTDDGVLLPYAHNGPAIPTLQP